MNPGHLHPTKIGVDYLSDVGWKLESCINYARHSICFLS